MARHLKRVPVLEVAWDAPYQRPHPSNKLGELLKKKPTGHDPKVDVQLRGQANSLLRKASSIKTKAKTHAPSELRDKVVSSLKSKANNLYGITDLSKDTMEKPTSTASVDPRASMLKVRKDGTIGNHPDNFEYKPIEKADVPDVSDGRERKTRIARPPGHTSSKKKPGTSSQSNDDNGSQSSDNGAIDVLDTSSFTKAPAINTRSDVRKYMKPTNEAILERALDIVDKFLEDTMSGAIASLPMGMAPHDVGSAQPFDADLRKKKKNKKNQVAAIMALSTRGF